MKDKDKLIYTSKPLSISDQKLNFTCAKCKEPKEVTLIDGRYMKLWEHYICEDCTLKIFGIKND